MFDGAIDNPVALVTYLVMLGLCAPLALHSVFSRQGVHEPAALSAFAIGSVTIMWSVLAPLTILSLAQGGSMIWLFGAEERDTGVVEYSTVLAWGLIAVLCLKLAYRRRSWERAFYSIGAAVAVIALGEEISWGQWLFFWSSPEFFEERNLQGETNVHNFFPPQAFEIAYAVVGAGLVAVAVAVRYSALGDKVRWTGVSWLRRSRWGLPLALSAAVMMQHHLFQELSELALTMAALYALCWICWVADPLARAVKPSTAQI